jgi:hypothetical protein
MPADNVIYKFAGSLRPAPFRDNNDVYTVCFYVQVATVYVVRLDMKTGEDIPRPYCDWSETGVGVTQKYGQYLH